MNIFDTLVKGKGCINEENISSFLGYLLDPSEDHGLKDIFFNNFLQLVEVDESEIETTDLNKVEIKLEYPVSNRKRIIDIVFETNNHVIAIENKISEQSKQKNQLQEEYNGLKDSDLAAKPIIMCYLVPEKNNDSIILRDEDKQITILWNDILDILTTILQQENSAKINPISDYVKHTLKAFINFMNNTLKPKYFNCDNKVYRIYKYSSGQIIIEERINGIWECVTAKPIIRKMLENKFPDKYSWDNTSGAAHTTRSLGAKLFKELK